MGDRILITGGAGFLGAHLARRFLRDGADVVLLDDLSRGQDDPEFAELQGQAEFIRHDLTRPLTDRRLARPFDAVYHLAAVVGVGEVTADPARTLRVNLASTLSLTEWCGRNPPGSLFLSSTSEVADGAGLLGLASYPLPESVPFVLTAPRSARSSYALSKMACEALVGHLGSQTRVRIGRYHNIYGPRMGMSHVIPQLIARLLRGDDPFILYGADHTRSFCHVADAVDATMRLMAVRDPAVVVANIGNDLEETVIGALAAELFSLAGRLPVVDSRPAPEGTPLRRLPDLTTLRTLTGYQPAMRLSDGLPETYQWYERRLAASA
jgi:UDP-glucose 4-epimerase/UDP-glucuronate decarboxylase